MNPVYKQNIQTYTINDLVFKGATYLKNSPVIKQIVIPPDSLQDSRNKRGGAQYKRLINQANFTNYPQMALTNALGLTSKGDAQITVPDAMSSLIDYATTQNTPLAKIQDELLASIFKFGLAGIKIEISDDTATNEPPRLQVIEGCDIVDGASEKMGNMELYKWILLDASVQVFDESTKRYQLANRYKVLGLDADGVYYEALINKIDWSTFDLAHPESSKSLTIVRPAFFENLKFIPFVAVNPSTVELKWDNTSFIQNLIDTSLSIFQLDADLRAGLHQQSNGFLAIYGSSMKSNEVIQGMYAVNIFSDPAAKAEYVTPNVAGMTAQMEKLKEMQEDAIQQIFSILHVTEGASGDALALRIQSSTTSLVSVVKTIGSAITRVLEMVATIMSLDVDTVSYEPYLDFAQLKTGEEVKQEVMVADEEPLEN